MDLPKCVDCQCILPDNANEHKCRKDLTDELDKAINKAIMETLRDQELRWGEKGDTNVYRD